MFLIDNIPQSTSIIAPGDELVTFTPYAYCLKAQAGRKVKFSVLKESNNKSTKDTAQAEGRILEGGESLLGRYTQVRISSGSLLCYVKSKN